MTSATAELNTALESSSSYRLSDTPQYTLGNISTQEKKHLLSKFGHQSSSYFTLQPNVEFFGCKHRGYISFQRQKTVLGQVIIVFCDPVCKKEYTFELIRAFLLNTPGKTIFLGVTKEIASILRMQNYYTNQMGTEFSLELKSFQVKGKDKKHLRHAANLGKRYGLTVRELSWTEIDQNEVHRISESWRLHKTVNNRELKLLTRPPEFRNEWEVRKFYCFEGKSLLGYVFFDPYFENGKVIGYCANIIRKCPQAKPSDLLDYIILEAIKIFRQEGIGQLSLGISPLYNIEQETGDRAIVRGLQKFLYHHGNSLYAFKPLAYHKTRYRGDENKWYICTRNISLIKTALAVLQGTQLAPKINHTDRNRVHPLSISMAE